MSEESAATASTLKRMLEERGLAVVAVTENVRDPDEVTVYLHGASGQWADGAALNTISRTPGVLSAIQSDQTPAIVTVRLAPSPIIAVADKPPYQRPLRRIRRV
jgi:hypothetical protein